LYLPIGFLLLSLSLLLFLSKEANLSREGGRYGISFLAAYERLLADDYCLASSIDLFLLRSLSLEEGRW
jgi:hypothetical protein